MINVGVEDAYETGMWCGGVLMQPSNRAIWGGEAAIAVLLARHSRRQLNEQLPGRL
jgi:hypothetical protein